MSRGLDQRPRLALTVGDPAGIGPEIVLKALASPERPEGEWVVYGPLASLEDRASRFRLRAPASLGVEVVDTGGGPFALGQVSAEGGRAAASAVLGAARAHRDAGRGGRRRRRDHDVRRDVVRSAVEALAGEGLDVSGALPADTAFVRAARGEFDAVVAAYHDQGLVPVKLLAFGHAVNVTLGLPFVRTSVDHGTAFDIAGRGTADPGSLLEAMKLAATLAC